MSTTFLQLGHWFVLLCSCCWIVCNASTHHCICVLRTRIVSHRNSN